MKGDKKIFKTKEGMILSSNIILIVEDDRGLNKIIQKSLQKEGFKTEGVFEGTDAISFITKNQNILLLLDFKLPDMTGEEVIRNLIAKKLEVPFMVMTGHGDEKIAVEMMKLGAIDYIIKDLDFIELLPQKVKIVCKELEKEKKLEEAEKELKKYHEHLEELVEERTIELSVMNKELKQEIKERKRIEKELNKLNLELEERVKMRTILLKKEFKERKKMEGVMWESEELFRTIVETAPSLLQVVDENGKTVYISPNSKEIIGYSQEELMGKEVWWVHEDDTWKAKKLYDQTFTEKNGYKNFEYKAVKKNGDLWYASSSWEPLKDKDGKFKGVIFLTIDVTKRKQAEDELKKHRDHLEELVKERTAELESFTYSVSHDLRAPLRAIEGFSRMMEEKYEAKLNSEGKRILNVIQNSTQMMGQLIDDLLTLSHLGRQDMNINKTSVKALASIVFKEIKFNMAFKKLKFQIKNIPSAFADKRMIRQVFFNLFSNAVKFTKPKQNPEIEVGGEAREDTNIYYVRDNGVGFNMKYSDKLFGVFQRLHTQREFEGTGVGLAIVKRIINRHGGRVWAEGKVNGGATFYFSLPKEGDRVRG